MSYFEVKAETQTRIIERRTDGESICLLEREANSTLEDWFSRGSAPDSIQRSNSTGRGCFAPL